MNWLRFGSRASALVVAAVAGYSSWRHIVEVASRAGEDATVAAVLPLSVDGLVVVSSLAMLEDKRALLEPRLSARVGLGFGILATLAFNLASADRTGTAMAVAAVPAVAFLLSVEVLSRSGKPKGAHTVRPLPGDGGDIPGPHAVHASTVPGPGPVAAVTVTAPVPQADPGASESGHPEPVKGVTIPTPSASPLVASLPSTDGSVPPVWKTPGGQSNAERVRLTAARLPADATLTQIAAAAAVSESTVRRHLPADHPLRNGKARKPAGADPVPAGAST